MAQGRGRGQSGRGEGAAVRGVSRALELTPGHGAVGWDCDSGLVWKEWLWRWRNGLGAGGCRGKGEDAQSQPGWRGLSWSWEAAQHLAQQQGGDTAPPAPGAGRDWAFAEHRGSFPHVNPKGSNPLIVALAKGFLALRLLLLRAG